MIEDATAKFDTKFSGNAKRLAEKALVANCYMYAIMRSGKVKLAKPDINLNKIVHRMYAKVACDVAFKQPHLFDTTIKNGKMIKFYDQITDIRIFISQSFRKLYSSTQDDRRSCSDGIGRNDSCSGIVAIGKR